MALNDAKLSNQALVVRDLENDLALERDVATTAEHHFNDLRSEVARLLVLVLT
ncbi:hypothetical protein Tco_0515533, partial [Tanacetum coccineum]